jgi:hypothetical protein
MPESTQATIVAVVLLRASVSSPLPSTHSKLRMSLGFELPGAVAGDLTTSTGTFSIGCGAKNTKIRGYLQGNSFVLSAHEPHLRLNLIAPQY